MKHIASSTLLALVLLGVSALPAQAQFGIAGGANFDSVSDIQNGQNVSENATGYHIGVVYDLSLGPVSIRPGLFYRKVGSYDFSDVPDAEVEDLDVTAFEVPIDLRVTVLPTPLVSPYLVGGPNAFLPRSSEDNFDEDFKDVSFTFNIGVGANVSVPGVGLTLQPELRYEFGASDYIGDDFDVGNTSFSPSDRKLSAYALRLNVLF